MAVTNIWGYSVSLFFFPDLVNVLPATLGKMQEMPFMPFSAAFQIINNNQHRMHCLLWLHVKSRNTCTTLCQNTLSKSLGHELLAFVYEQEFKLIVDCM